MGLLKGGQIESPFSKERMELIGRISFLQDIYKILTNETDVKYIFKSRTFGLGRGHREVLQDDKLQVEGNINRFLDRLQQELLQLEDGTIVKLGKSVKSQEMPLPATSKKRKCRESKKETQPSRKSTHQKIKPQKLQEGWASEECGLVTRVGARVDVFWTDDLEGTSS